jgi:hypothetical protein
MNKPHKHAELIKQWADGVEIMRKSWADGLWHEEPYPSWGEDVVYRAKPQPVECWVNVYPAGAVGPTYTTEEYARAGATQGLGARAIHMREVTE